MIRVSRRIARYVAATIIVLALAVAVRIAADGLAPRIAAGADAIAVQQSAAERAIGKAYLAAADQLHKSRELRLPISDAQAATIEQLNLDDLRTLRHNALVSVGTAMGFSAGDAENYAKTAETRLDASATPAPGAQVLLAPRLFAIVQRMDDLASQIADRGTREMTVAPGASPTAAPSATPSPSVRPSASPTRAP